MKIISQNKDNTEITFEIGSNEELWYLSQIISPGDRIKANTERKIKIDAKSDDTKFKRVNVTLTIEVEKLEFSGNILKVLGKIVDGPEFISRGEYHSIKLEEKSKCTLIKIEWPKYQETQFKELKELQSKTDLIILYDREDALFATLNNQGYSILNQIKGNIQKKQFSSNKESNFYQEITKILDSYCIKYKPETIIIGTQQFWRKSLEKEIDSKEYKKKIIFVDVSDIQPDNISRILNNPKIEQQLKHVRIKKEIEIVEKLLSYIGKNKEYSYGIEDITKANDCRAIKELIITDKCIKKFQEEDNFLLLDTIMKDADQSGAEIHIIQSDFEHGKKVDALGGIAALLRFPVE